jgi:hypothetical protein
MVLMRTIRSRFKAKDMRIKFNDKIYRLKEIESGVDSLMELVEEPKYNDGDFVYEDGRIMIVNEFSIKRIGYHALIYPQIDLEVVYNDNYASPIVVSSLNFRYATEEEKQLLIDAMKKDGKRWNAEKKCIEDIPKRKFKVGDKVRIKDGISSETHWNIAPSFTSTMDKFIGKELTVKGYRGGFAVISEDYSGYYFNEDWLEPYTEKLKKGELAIFWDYSKDGVTVRRYGEKAGLLHSDILGYIWPNAIRFESKEQLDKILKGQI